MNVSKILGDLLDLAFEIAKENQYEYVTPELVLFAFCHNEDFEEAVEATGAPIEILAEHLRMYMENHVKAEGECEPEFSNAMGQVFDAAQHSAQASGRNYIDMEHVLHGIFGLENSYAVYYLSIMELEESSFLDIFLEYHGANRGAAEEEGDEQKEFEAYAPCINDGLEDKNPLIGREMELERTIQILCRKEKNNPIHIGEPGVGKTAITYGLARMINEGKMPEPLKGARIYALDLGSLLAGTQYRGDLERRLKKLLEEISKEENPIIYIDEIHNLAGAGAVGESSLDVSNMLKPYLAQGKIRFIGATTDEEYKKYFEKNKSLARRFQNVDITEPSQEETVRILNGLKKKYEKFHGVHYGKGVLEYAVAMSVKYMNERFLPDKAIDLMDEAGAYRRIHPLDQKSQSVGKDVINEILTKICRVPVESVEQENESSLATLKERMLARVFGQDEAVAQVVNAVMFAKAGLLEDQKPLSSFLFAGPTGVGKTEIAKSLAAELGVKLLRFDMSEYGEKHAIAKLIGSPAGYVGYEEGGLLTEAIRKNPSCVLLLDEIEKAHPDIFHILLQVMDYATLTDNQGRKADFRNAIIIMTSNAGATEVGKPSLGFVQSDHTSNAILEAVKHLFQPEFRNRLNGIVVFHAMNEEMALKIAEKKLKELIELVGRKKVVLTFTEEAVRLLQKKGTTREFGAREMDRVIQNEIKPLLVEGLLTGKLKKTVISTEGEQFVLS